MARLIRMDGTGHSTLAEWTTQDDAAFQSAVEEFRGQLEMGYIGTVPDGPGKAVLPRARGRPKMKEARGRQRTGTDLAPAPALDPEGRHEQRTEAAWVQFCGLDHLLCLYASGGHG